VDEEIARIAKEPPTAQELERAKNKIESGAVFALEPLGGFGGRAARLADYALRTGDPGYLDEDLARYRAVTAADVSEAARRWLLAPRVSLTVVPRGGEPGPAGAAGKGAVR
jgi:zinc protease